MSFALTFAAQKSASGKQALPAGFVQMLEDRRIYAIAGWIVAVGISPITFIVAQPRPQPVFPSPLLEQLVGFLVGRGAEVLRMDIRFPGTWHKPGCLEATSRFWASQFLAFARERRLFLWLPRRLKPPVVLPVEPAARTAIEVWSEAAVLLRALNSEFPGSLGQIRPTIWRLAKDWELQWNVTLKCAIGYSTIATDDWVLINSADRAWANLVRNYLEPHGFLMEPDSIARLL